MHKRQRNNSTISLGKTSESYLAVFAEKEGEDENTIVDSRFVA
jgi:hypothetical protein